jgi:hypothetical protein
MGINHTVDEFHVTGGKEPDIVSGGLDPYQVSLTTPKIEDGFSPSELNPLAWYDASLSSSITLSDSNHVSQWNDLSGNNYHLTQDTLADQPSITGRNSIMFWGSDHDYMENFNLPDLSGGSVTIIAVVRFQGRILTQTNQAWAYGRGWHMVGKTTPTTIKNDVYPNDATASDLEYGSQHILGLRGGANGGIESGNFWLDGANDGVYDGMSTKGSFRIGGEFTTSSFHGEIMEFFVFNYVLSDSQMLELDTYLAAKWDEAKQTIAAMPVALTTTEETALTTFINAEKSVGNWHKYTLLSPQIFASSTNRKKNLIRPIESVTESGGGFTYETDGTRFNGAGQLYYIHDLKNFWYPTDPNIGMSFFINESGATQDYASFGGWFTTYRFLIRQLSTLDKLDIELQTGSSWQTHNIKFPFFGKMINATRYRTTNDNWKSYEDGVLEASGIYSVTYLNEVNRLGLGGNHNTSGRRVCKIGFFATHRADGWSYLNHYNNVIQLMKDLDVFVSPILARFPNPLSAGEEDAIRTFVHAEVDNGNWFLMDEFQCYALSDSSNAVIGWKGNGNATLIANPTHNGTYSGFYFNGTNQSLNTNINPSAFDTNFRLGSGFSLVWKGYSNVAANNTVIGGSGNWYRMRSSVDRYQGGINNEYSASNCPVRADVNSSDQLVGIIREVSSASGMKEVVNGVKSTTFGAAASTLANAKIHIAAKSGTSEFSNCSIDAFSTGIAAGFDFAAHHTNLTNLLTSLNAL